MLLNTLVFAYPKPKCGAPPLTRKCEIVINSTFFKLDLIKLENFNC